MYDVNRNLDGKVNISLCVSRAVPIDCSSWQTRMTRACSTFGKVKALREGMGLTQEEAATRAGFRGRQAWNNIESGRQATISLATLAKLAAVFGVDARELLKAGAAACAKSRAKGKASK